MGDSKRLLNISGKFLVKATTKTKKEMRLNKIWILGKELV